MKIEALSPNMHLFPACPALIGVDVKTSGLATHYIPIWLLPELETRLRTLGANRRSASAPLLSAAASHTHVSLPLDLSSINQVLSELESEAGIPPEGSLTPQQLSWIRRHFGGREPSVGLILASMRSRLEQLGQHPGREAAEVAWTEETLVALDK